MSYAALEPAKVGADILKRVGEGFDRADRSLSERFTDPNMRKLAAARVSLEYAVIQTAMEKRMPTEVIAQALHNASPQHQAMMIKEGRMAVGRAYGVEPDVLVSALAGKVVDLQMPRGFGSTPEFDKMIDTARNTVTAIVQENYATRGRFDAGKTNYVALQSDGKTGGVRVELAGRLAFIESSIDSAVTKGGMTQNSADMLKARIEAQVFQPRPPQSITFSKGFKEYFESDGARIRGDVMKDVRSITQSKLVQQIGEKVQAIGKPIAPGLVKEFER